MCGPCQEMDDPHFHGTAKTAGVQEGPYGDGVVVSTARHLREQDLECAVDRLVPACDVPRQPLPDSFGSDLSGDRVVRQCYARKADTAFL